MKFRWVLSKLVGAHTLFQAFLVLLLENALPFSFHNNPYYLVAPNDHERFIYLFCTAIPFFCIFTFQDNLVRVFTSVYISGWCDGDILFRWKGITVETSISLNFQFSSQTDLEMAKSDYHLKKFWCSKREPCFTPFWCLSSSIPSVPEISEYKCINIQITSAEVRAFE